MTFSNQVWNLSICRKNFFNRINSYSIQKRDRIEKVYGLQPINLITHLKIKHNYNLFEKFNLLRIFVEEKNSELRHKGSTCENTWVEIFTQFHMQRTGRSNSLCLSGFSQSLTRGNSFLIKYILVQEKSQLKVLT